MKRGTRLLATLGLVSTGFSIGLAQTTEAPEASQTPENTLPPAYFTDQSEPQRPGLTVQDTPTRPDTDALGERFRRNRFRLDSSRTPASASNSIPLPPVQTSPKPVSGTALQTIQRRIPATPASPKTRVEHAEFQQPPGQKATVQPVDFDGTLPPEPTPLTSTRAPLDEFSEEIRTRFELPDPATAASPADPVQDLFDLDEQTVDREVPQMREMAPATPMVLGPQTPLVTVTWVRKTDINVGQTAEFELLVKNEGGLPANEIAIEAKFPTSVRMTGADPEPQVVENSAIWKLNRLAPGATRTIAVSMIPTRRGPLTTQATVRFTGVSAAQFEVEEPLLQVAIEGNQNATVGDSASQLIAVSNPGSGVARNVTIEATIPSGLEHPRGELLQMEIGSLAPGETRRIRLSMVAVEGGTHQLQVRARAAAGLDESARTQITVIAPSLKLAVEGPRLRYSGRSGNYTLAITNDGTVASNNVRAKYRIPEGFQFVKADHGGKFDSTSRMVDWFIGGLEPGESSKVMIELKCDQLGEFNHQAMAVSEHGARSVASLVTRVDGSASLVLDISDKHDPIEVGRTTDYVIRVKNKGTKAATNVGVSCELSQGVEFVSARGPGQSLAENGLVVFRSIPSLPPGQEVTFTVSVQGKTEGNHRFRARLASDSISDPLIFEELTKFYAEN